MTVDLNEIKEFTQNKISNISRPVRHYFRNRYSHTLRVLKWAERIHEFEGGDLEVIKIASILHDIGWEDGENHAITSRNIANDYLKSIQYDVNKLPLILEAIESHNSRMTDKKLHIESFILMDADILDEVGALSILWDAMAAALEQVASYKKAYERIIEYTNQIKQRVTLLRTETGLRFYHERIKVIDHFLDNLEYELGVTLC